MGGVVTLFMATSNANKDAGYLRIYILHGATDSHGRPYINKNARVDGYSCCGGEDCPGHMVTCIICTSGTHYSMSLCRYDEDAKTESTGNTLVTKPEIIQDTRYFIHNKEHKAKRGKDI